jgi:DNA-binding transcriptional MerR regulator
MRQDGGFVRVISGVTMRTISEVAKLLDVDRELVKSWIGEFSVHLSEWAKPEAGRTRLFTDSDTRALALVSDLWESDPDLENIHACLNTGDQDSDRYVELVHLATPVFQEVPADLDETWHHGVLLSSMWLRPTIEVARAYKYAADELVKEALSCHEPHLLDYPIFHMYRHVLELYLKLLLDDPPQAKKLGHDLPALIKAVEKKFNSRANEWVMERIREFSVIDPTSDLFRFSDRPLVHPKHIEVWVDFVQLKTTMSQFCEAFEERLRR